MSHLVESYQLWFLGTVILVALAEVSAVQLDSRSAEEWVKILEEEDRVSGLKIEEVMARLKLKPGDVVADIGAGTGIFSMPLARAVAPAGTVFAVEIDQKLLDYIDERSKREKVADVQTVLGEFADPKLPSREVDLAFFHNVLHHIEHRRQYLDALDSYLKSDGRVVVIDRIRGRPGADHGHHTEVHNASHQVKELMADAGFDLIEEFDLFEDKFFLVFAHRNP